MDLVLLADDGVDAGAPARREAARERHLASIRASAAAGRLLMSGPRLRADGSVAGSLQVFRLPDRTAMEAYLAEEPFAREGVWASWKVLDARLAPAAWWPQPGRSGGEAGPLHAFAILARDGTDADAPARRLAVRPRHFERLAGEVAAGRARLGGAILDAPE
ncbi:MAG: YciI family protein, partial [Acetobacteraceae bacterium]|nr:YciI family protein [Acetobacteraceae bacterium]